MKRFSVMMLTGTLMLGIFAAGCGAREAVDTTTTAESQAEVSKSEADVTAAASAFDSSEYFSVISREDGSGTRGAFIELFGIEEKDETGEKVDNTTDEAVITNSTDVMMTTVSGDEYAIGYCSLGSLNDSVKAVTIDGVAPEAVTVKDGSYAIARPFNVATNGEVSPAAQDFLNYILSAQGQAIVEENGYIAAVDGAEDFVSQNAEGKIVIAGSSSVTPVMEKIKEAYEAVNPAAEIEIQESDSTTGMTAAMDGTCDIGMASRDLKDSETEAGLTATVIAKDGIAVIVNRNNPVDDFAVDQVKGIFTGEFETWSEVVE